MEPQIFTVHTHKKASKQIPKKVNTDGTPVIKTVKQRTKKVAELDADGNEIEPVVLKQKFEVTHGEKSCVIKMGNMSFGIKLGDLGIENVMRSTESKDTENIRSILNVMKTMKKANISFAAIAARVTVATQSLPQSIKQLSNNLNKPIEQKPVAIVVTDTVAEINHHSDDNYATPEHLHL